MNKSKITRNPALGVPREIGLRREGISMRSAEQITEVAQSEYVWDLYVRSGISRSGASDLDALNEARRILETKSVAFANCHLERERVIKALERINVLSSCGIDGLQSVKKLAQNEASGFRNEPLFFAGDEKQTHAPSEQSGSPGTAQL